VGASPVFHLLQSSVRKKMKKKKKKKPAAVIERSALVVGRI
jgi:hypothetical protein